MGQFRGTVSLSCDETRFSNAMSTLDAGGTCPDLRKHQRSPWV